MDSQNINIVKSTANQSKLISEIVNATKQLSEDENSQILQAQLFQIVGHCLDHQLDETLMKAIEKAQVLKLDAVLKEIILNAAETDVVCMNSGKTGEAMLFAIPLVLIKNIENDLPDRIDHPQRACQLFRKFGLISHDHEIVLHDELLTVEDINFPPSEMRKINRTLSQQALHGCQMFQTAKNSVKTDNELSEGRIVLRFLIGVAISDMREIAFLPDDSKLNAYQKGLEQWTPEFIQEINVQTGHVVWDIDPPRILSSSVLPGIRLLHYVGFFYELSCETVSQQSKIAIISQHGDHSQCQEIRIGFYDASHEQLTGYIWPIQCSEDQAIILEAVDVMLIRFNIEKMTIEQILPRTQGESESQPFFPSPKEILKLNEQKVTLH